MKNLLKKWAHPDHYAGETYFEYYCGLGRHRDSDLLQESNFESALERLGGESETVIVARAGHWAVGWVESILVHESNKKALKILNQILVDLDNYPVLDESDFSERESEYQAEYAEQAKEDLAEALATHFRIRNSKELQDIAFELNMDMQCYAGNDACVNIYPHRTPDERDVKELEGCLKRIEYQCRNSSSGKMKAVYDRLLKKVSAYKAESSKGARKYA